VCQKENRKKTSAASALRRYHEKHITKRGDRKEEVGKYKSAWTWLARYTDEYGEYAGKRTILHTLEEKTEANDWPWPSPLDGVGMSVPEDDYWAGLFTCGKCYGDVGA
jgi:hypothetical protein